MTSVFSRPIYIISVLCDWLKTSWKHGFSWTECWSSLPVVLFELPVAISADRAIAHQLKRGAKTKNTFARLSCTARKHNPSSQRCMCLLTSRSLAASLRKLSVIIPTRSGFSVKPNMSRLSVLIGMRFCETNSPKIAPHYCWRAILEEFVSQNA